MELSSITDKLVQNLQQAQLDQIKTITKVLDLKIGSQFTAEAQKVTQATPDERAQLIKSIDANLAQLNKNSSAPAVKELINQLLEQKNLAQTPSLKLVTLAITTPTTPVINSAVVNTPPAAITTLLTYTNQPIQLGQTLLMQLGDGQRLQLLQPLTKAELATVSALIQTLNLKSPVSPHGTSVLPGDSPSVLLEQNKAASIKTTEAIGETLRRLLPQKDKGQDLLVSLPKITQFIHQLPIADRKEWLSSQVQQSLKTLSNHIRLTDQLSNPKLLEMTLNNNGQRFEHKLAQLVASQPNSSSSVANTTAIKIDNQIGTNNKLTASPQISIEKMATQDLKGALLGLLHQLDTELENAKPTLPGLPPTYELPKNTLAIALPQFLGMLANKQQGELNQKQLRTQLVMLMHQYTLGSIAKIQLQQVHTLNHQLSQAEQTQPTQSWQFEIPVRQGHDVHPLHIQMEQQWVDEQNENEEQNNTRVRQWNVMFTFDLSLVGRFYAQLNLLGDSLSAKFWAENENTLLEAKNKTDGLKLQLEREGIQVAQMQFVPGLPPKPKMSFSYSLVDIKT